MTKYLVTFIFAALYFVVMAQTPPENLPPRTPEEIARKQNSTLARELNLTDSSQLDTLYRMHLKYARMRAVSNTRAEDLERLQAMIAELKGILTAEQYARFMTHQVEHRPRHPQVTFHPTNDTNRISPKP